MSTQTAFSSSCVLALTEFWCGTKLDHGVRTVGYGTDDNTDYWKSDTEQMLTVPEAEGCDQLVDDDGEATLWMHEGTDLERAFAEDEQYQEPRVPMRLVCCIRLTTDGQADGEERLEQKVVGAVDIQNRTGLLDADDINNVLKIAFDCLRSTSVQRPLNSSIEKGVKIHT